MSRRRHCEHCGGPLGFANAVQWDEVCLIVCDNCVRQHHEQERKEAQRLKTWRYYDVLIRGIGDFWTPDWYFGHQERYYSPEAARERAAYLYHERGEAEVQVRERTETIIAVWPEEKEQEAG